MERKGRKKHLFNWTYTERFEVHSLPLLSSLKFRKLQFYAGNISKNGFNAAAVIPPHNSASEIEPQQSSLLMDFRFSNFGNTTWNHSTKHSANNRGCLLLRKPLIYWPIWTEYPYHLLHHSMYLQIQCIYFDESIPTTSSSFISSELSISYCTTPLSSFTSSDWK